MGKSDKYHVSHWGGKKWQCCRAPMRMSEGCESCSEWNRTTPNSPIIKNGDNNSPILGECYIIIFANIFKLKCIILFESILYTEKLIKHILVKPI